MLDVHSFGLRGPFILVEAGAFINPRESCASDPAPRAGDSAACLQARLASRPHRPAPARLCAPSERCSQGSPQSPTWSSKLVAGC